MGTIARRKPNRDK